MMTIVQIMEFLVVHFLEPPATTSLFGPNILLSTMFSNQINTAVEKIKQLINHLKPTDKCMFQLLTLQRCILYYGSCVILIVNSDYFLQQH
jgi:hypothetical protein